MLVLKLLQRSRLPLLEFDDAGRLVEELAPFLRLAGEDPVDLTLADDRIAFLPDACVIENFVDIPESDRRVVDQVLALSGAVETPRHRDLLIIHIKTVIRIVEGDRNGSEALGLPGLGTGEDHVLHAAAAQLLRALLAQHPAHRVGDIGFARTVRPHDAGDALLELELQLVGEGFEALYLD